MNNRKFDILNEEAVFDLMLDEFLSGKDIEESWGVKDIKRFKETLLATYKLVVKFNDEEKILQPNKVEQTAFDLKFHFIDFQWRIMKNKKMDSKVIVGKNASVNEWKNGFSETIDGKKIQFILKK